MQRVQLGEQRIRIRFNARFGRRCLAAAQPVVVVAPNRSGIRRRSRHLYAGERIHAWLAPINIRHGLPGCVRRRGAVEPEAPHEARAFGPGLPVVAPVVAPMEQIVGVQHHAPRRQRRHLELAHQWPAGIRDRGAHPFVVAGAAGANVRLGVGGFGAAYRHALHAVQVVGEIQVVRAGEVVLILLVVEGPVVRIGHHGGGPHVLRHGLRVVEQLHLHGLVMALLAAVERAVVVLVPVLIVGAAGEGRVVGEGHDGPVAAKQRIACRNHAGRFDDAQDVRHRGGGDGGAVVAVGALLLFVDALVDVLRDAELLRPQHHQAAAGELALQAFRPSGGRGGHRAAGWFRAAAVRSGSISTRVAQ